MLMVVVVYALFDRKLREYGAPVISKNEETMRRALVTELKGSNSMPDKYPEDFDLYELGTLDQDTGAIAPRVALIANLSDILKTTEVK